MQQLRFSSGRRFRFAEPDQMPQMRGGEHRQQRRQSQRGKQG